MVPVTPIPLGVMLRSWSGIGPPRGEGKTTPGKEKQAEPCTHSPGTVEMALVISPHPVSPRAVSPDRCAAMAGLSQLLISALCHWSGSGRAYFYSPEGCRAKCFDSHVTNENT